MEYDSLTLTTMEYDMITVYAKDRLGRRVEVKCSPDDTIEVLKKLIGAQLGTEWHKIKLKRQYIELKNHITLGDYEVHDKVNLDLE